MSLTSSHWLFGLCRRTHTHTMYVSQRENGSSSSESLSFFHCSSTSSERAPGYSRDYFAEFSLQGCLLLLVSCVPGSLQFCNSFVRRCRSSHSTRSHLLPITSIHPTNLYALLKSFAFQHSPVKSCLITPTRRLRGIEAHSHFHIRQSPSVAPFVLDLSPILLDSKRDRKPLDRYPRTDLIFQSHRRLQEQERQVPV